MCLPTNIAHCETKMTEDEVSFKNLISTRQKSRGALFLSLLLRSNFIIT